MAGSGFFRGGVRKDVSRMVRGGNSRSSGASSGGTVIQPSVTPPEKPGNSYDSDQAGPTLADQESQAAAAPKTPAADGAAGEGDKSLSPEQINNAENDWGETDRPFDYKKDQDKRSGRGFLKDIFTDKKKRKNAAVSGGLLVALAIGSIFGGVFFSGPLHAIYFSQLMSELHLSDNEYVTDERFTRLVRYIRDPSKPQNTRMGYLGNKLADRVEKKMNAIGISSSYTKTFGLLDGYVIDPAKLNGDLYDARGKSQEEVIKYFNDKYKVKLTPHPDAPGKLFASADGLGLFQKRKLMSVMLAHSGYRGIFGGFVFRVTATRAKINLHPFSPLRTAVVDGTQAEIEKRRKEYEERRKNNIENGVDAPTVTTDTSTNPDDEATTNNAEDVEQTTGDIVEEANGDEASRARLKTRLGAKISTVIGVGGGALNVTDIVGTACTVKYLAAIFDQTMTTNYVLPLMRLGMDLVASGGQVQEGTDADLDQLGWLESYFYDDTTGTSWTDARSIQQNVGDPLSGPPDPPEVRIDPRGNFLTQIANSIPELDNICKVYDNTGVQAGFTVLSFLGGPISASVGLAASLAMQPFIPQIISALAGEPIDTHVHGAPFGSYVDYGVKLAANDVAAAAGGVAITPQQESQLVAVRNQVLDEDFKSQSIAYRLFNLKDNRSLASKMLIESDIRPNQSIASMGNTFFNILSLPGKVLGHMLFARTSASPMPYNYGFPTIANPVSELTNPAVSNPYANASQVINRILPGPMGKTYIDRALICNGEIIGTDGSVLSASDPPSLTDINKPENNCSDTSIDWMRVRFYMKDTQIMEAASCYEGVKGACGNIGFGDSQ